MTQEAEGVIKYRLNYVRKPPPNIADFSRLNAWRTVLHRLRLVGQDPKRYGGYGFGNISQRIEPFSSQPQSLRFIISGSQTGQLEQLDENAYCTVLQSDPEENCVRAEGPVEPSSEALTHAAVYALHNRIRTVMHVHSAEIWERADALCIPSISQEIAYGTPAMAVAVLRLFRSSALQTHGIFAMRGHEDGIVAFGQTAEETGQLLVTCLALALAESA